MACVMCGFSSLSLIAEEAKNTYVIQRGDETLVVTDMPKPTVSVPITNSFVYIDGEYIEPPYVVSISNLSVRINGRVAYDAERYVKKREWYLAQPFPRVGITPESVGDEVTGTYEFYVRRLENGTISHIVGGGILTGASQGDGDGGAMALIEKARKAAQGDEQAKQAFANEMGLTAHKVTPLHPDWIERLANNTNLETRATKILEAKRLRERQE